MSYTPSELTSILPNSPPSPSTTWLPVLPISIPATTYTATQTAQPCSGFIRPPCLSPLSLRPCHRKQHAPAGVTSQPEQCPCLLHDDLTTIQAHEYLHLWPPASRPHSRIMCDNVLALPNFFLLRYTMMGKLFPATSTPLFIEHTPSNKFSQI